MGVAPSLLRHERPPPVINIIMTNDPTPGLDYEHMTDRAWSTLASNQASKAISVAGDLASRWNTMIADNRYLQSRCDGLEDKLKDMSETLNLLSSIVLDKLA